MMLQGDYVRKANRGELPRDDFKNSSLKSYYRERDRNKPIVAQPVP